MQWYMCVSVFFKPPEVKKSVTADNPSMPFLFKNQQHQRSKAAAALGNQLSTTQKGGQTEICISLTSEKMKSLEMEGSKAKGWKEIGERRERLQKKTLHTIRKRMKQHFWTLAVSIYCDADDGRYDLCNEDFSLS